MPEKREDKGPVNLWQAGESQLNGWIAFDPHPYGQCLMSNKSENESIFSYAWAHSRFISSR